MPGTGLVLDIYILVGCMGSDFYINDKNISLKKNYIFKLFYQILSIILPLLTAPYISRILGAEGVGKYSFTSSILTYFTMFASLGTVTYGTREIAAARDDKQKMSSVFWGIELMTICTTSAAVVAWLVLSIFANGYREIIVAMTPMLIATAADISWLYTGLEKVHYTVTVNLICKIAGACAIFAFVKESGDLLPYTLIMSGSTCLGNLSMWLFLPRTVSRPQSGLLGIGRHFRQTLKYFLTSVAISVYTVLDKTMIGLITHSDAENGYYEQACKIVNIIKPFAFASINDIMAPRMSYLFAKNQKKEITKRINFSLNIELLLSVGCCFGLIAVAKTFVPLFFGPGYEPTVLLLQLMAPILIFICISTCLGSHYYVPSGRIFSGTKLTLAGSLLNIVANVPLILFFGAKGAVISSLLAEGVIAVLYTIFSKREIKYVSVWQILYKKLIAGAVMCFICSWLGNVLNASRLITLILQVITGIIIYISLLTVMRDGSTIDVLGRIHDKLRKCGL